MHVPFIRTMLRRCFFVEISLLPVRGFRQFFGGENLGYSRRRAKKSAHANDVGSQGGRSTNAIVTAHWADQGWARVLVQVHGRRIGMRNKAPATASFVHASCANGHALFRFKDAL